MAGRSALLEDAIEGITSKPKLESKDLTILKLALHEDDFSSPEFDIDEFIRECRQKIPLKTLIADLKEYSKSLNNELVELINKEYTDFVNLSANLSGIDNTINNLRMPLLTLQAETIVVADNIEQSIAYVKTKLSERREAAEKRRTLELMVDSWQCLCKIEALLEEQDLDNLLIPSDSESETGNILQRVANDFNRLNYFVSKGRHLPFVKNLESRITFIETTLQRSLEQLFREGIAKRETTTISDCLHTFAAIDRIQNAENIFRQVIVDPYVRKHVTANELSAVGLERLFDNFISFVHTECSFMLNVAHKSISGFNFLKNSIWCSLAPMILDELPIFAPGMVDSFRRNFTIYTNFLEQLEEFCATKEELTALRKDSYTTKILRHWNVPVYFGLRSREITEKFEATFENALPDPLPPSKELVMDCSRELWNSILQCWNSNVFLPVLLDSFFKLSLRLLSRYRSWVMIGLNILIPGAVELNFEVQASDTASSWAKILAPKNFVHIYHDCELLKSKLDDDFLPIAQGAMTLPTEAIQVIKDALKGEQGWLEEAMKLLSRIITQATIKRCVESLQPLRGIIATYRYTNKTVPTRHSYYVPNILNSVADFINNHNEYISESTRKEWMGQIFDTVTKKYVEMARDLLSTVAEQTQLLRKISQSNSQQQGDGISDIDKMSLQLYLDVEEYGRQLQKWDIDPTKFPPYVNLKEIVQPGERLSQYVEKAASQTQ